MIDNKLTRLLEEFQLQTDGTLDIERRRFREFIGLVRNV